MKLLSITLKGNKTMLVPQSLNIKQMDFFIISISSFFALLPRLFVSLSKCTSIYVISTLSYLGVAKEININY